MMADRPVQTIDEESEFEICGLCRKLTDVRKETHIDQRMFYVKGMGQLHEDCHNQVYGPEQSRLERGIHERYFKRQSS